MIKKIGRDKKDESNRTKEEGLEFSESGLVVTEIFTVLEDYLLDNEENGRSK